MLQQRLDKRRLASPEGTEVPTRLEGFDPDGDTEAESKGGADDDEPALDAEPASVVGQEEAGEGEEEGDEDEDGVDDTS